MSVILDEEITDTSVDSSFSSKNNPQLVDETIDDNLEEGEIITVIISNKGHRIKGH